MEHLDLGQTCVSLDAPSLLPIGWVVNECQFFRLIQMREEFKVMGLWFNPFAETQDMRDCGVLKHFLSTVSQDMGVVSYYSNRWVKRRLIAQSFHTLENI